MTKANWLGCAKWLGGAAIGLMMTTATPAETIKIGVMLPFSGVNADLGDVQVKAIDLYMKEGETLTRDIAVRFGN